MGREKQGYRDTVAALNDMFPDQGMLGRPEVARFLGVHRNTLDRYIKDGKISFKSGIERVSKADLARQICI